MVQIPRLREWREARALTQVELAERARISSRSVAGYEAGHGARPPTVRRLAEALGVDVIELVGVGVDSGKAQAPPSPEQPSFNGLLEEERRRAEREKLIEGLPGWIRAAVEDEEFVQRFEAAKSSRARALDLLTRQRQEKDLIIAQLRDLKERNAPPDKLQTARRDLAQARARETACAIIDVDLWRGREVADVRPVDIVAEVADAQGDIVAAFSGEGDDVASEAG
jgi:transcriptional regulator with XRE-family HTH domain